MISISHITMSQPTAIFEKLPFAPTLSDQVAQALLARIESGQLKPGEKLPPEAVLAPEFGVSRTVVREAISRLKHGGLLGSRQGSGVFVSIQPAIRPLKIDASVIESREAVLQIVEPRRALDRRRRRLRHSVARAHNLPRLKWHFALSIPRWLQAAVSCRISPFTVRSRRRRAIRFS